MLKAIFSDIVALALDSIITMVALNIVFPDLHLTVWRAAVLVLLFRMLAHSVTERVIRSSSAYGPGLHDFLKP